MKAGNNTSFIAILFYFMFILVSNAEEKILSSPLINLDDLTPSFEEVEETVDEISIDDKIKDKEVKFKSNNKSAILIGLDKITAKTSKITINMGESKKFGPLEIKVLKCGKIFSNNKKNSVAYLQVKDLSENENEKVFIFNGWTFSSDSTLQPFDHAIYDLQLVNCNNT